MIAWSSGKAATYGESNRGLMFIFVLGLFTAYMVLASQYNSFIHPFTVRCPAVQRHRRVHRTLGFRQHVEPYSSIDSFSSWE